MLGLTIEKSILTFFLGALVCGSVAFAAPKGSVATLQSLRVRVAR